MTSRTPDTHPWQPASSCSPPLQALQLRIRGDIALLLLVRQYLRFLRFGIAVCVLRRNGIAVCVLRRKRRASRACHHSTTKQSLEGDSGAAAAAAAAMERGERGGYCAAAEVCGAGEEKAHAAGGGMLLGLLLRRRRQTQTAAAASDCACTQKINECVTICNGCDGARALRR